MNKSAGILIICNNKVLLVHSTNSSWWKSYTPPKGAIEVGESANETASREVNEEVGILIDPSCLIKSEIVEYRTSVGKLYKTVQLFIYNIESYDEIGIENEHVQPSQLQREEVDEAKFFGKDEIEKKVLPRYLDCIMKY